MNDLNLDKLCDEQSINTITVAVNRKIYDDFWDIVLNKFPQLKDADFKLKGSVIDAYVNIVLEHYISDKQKD